MSRLHVFAAFAALRILCLPAQRLQEDGRRLAIDGRRCEPGQSGEYCSSAESQPER